MSGHKANGVAPAFSIAKARIAQRGMDFGLAWLLLTCLLASVGAMWSDGPGTFAAVVFLAGGCIALPVANWWSERKALRRSNEEALEKCHAALRFDPRNATAHAFLGEALCARGQYGAGIAEYEKALALKPSGEIAERWKWKLRRAREARDGMGTVAGVPRAGPRRGRAGKRRLIRYSALGMLAFDIFMAIASAPSLPLRAAIFCLAVFAVYQLERSGSGRSG